MYVCILPRAYPQSQPPSVLIHSGGDDNDPPDDGMLKRRRAASTVERRAQDPAVVTHARGGQLPKGVSYFS